MKCGRDVIDKFAYQRVREGARRGGQAIYGSLQLSIRAREVGSTGPLQSRTSTNCSSGVTALSLSPADRHAACWLPAVLTVEAWTYTSENCLPDRPEPLGLIMVPGC